MSGRTLRLTALLCLLAAQPTLAQVDLSGAWRSLRHEDAPDRGPGVGYGDYTGIPLTAAARQFAESWDSSRLTMPTQQCRVHVSPYIYRGPLNLRIWEEKDPKTQEVIAIKHYISTYEQTRTIWMDGRAHPPEWAPHTWMGFSTGRWSGNRLIVETTHIKNGWHRRNGVPSSDLTTMTEHYVRHGDQLTHIEVIRDPVYLTEPMVKSQNFMINVQELPARNWLWPCTAVEEVARDPNEVAHYLPGENPYLESSRREANISIPGAEGGAASTYPEWITASAAARAPAKRVIEAAPVRKPAAATDDVHVWPIREGANGSGVYMIVGAGANSLVQVGDDGVLVVDTKLAGSSKKLLAAIAELTKRPLRYIVDTNGDLDHIGGNDAVAAAGATRTGGVVVAQIGANITESAAIIAHENVLSRVSEAKPGSPDAVPQHAWPTDTFFTERQERTFNGDGIELKHVPNAHTDGDIVAYFRKADVLAVGDVYSTEGYPVIDIARGGSIDGTIAALNEIIEIAIPDVDHQGGTMIVPGHGRLSDEFDVAEYRDMLAIVRDRVRDLVKKGMTKAQVQAARPTLDWDARYGAESGAWTTAKFVDAVYDGVKGDAR